MSRWYKIVVGAETATQPGGQPASNSPGATWTSQRADGQADHGALKVELDIPVAPLAQPAGQAKVRIWGIPLSLILPGNPGALSAAQQFNGAPISVYGGMQAGLPLATAIAPKAGLLVQGMVLQAFGNWMGVNQTLDLVISTDGGATQSNPANIAFLWKQGSSLGAMILQVLAQAFPGVNAILNISPNLVLGADEPGTYQTLVQFAGYVKSVSQSIVGGDYPGVDIAFKGGKIIISDGTQAQASGSNVTALAFQDLIGQPTWLGPYTMQFTTVMRADLGFDSLVTFPPLSAYQTTTNQGSNSFARAPQTFSGQWRILYPRHIGNSRGPGAQSWVSTFQAVAHPSNEPQANSSAGAVGA